MSSNENNRCQTQVTWVRITKWSLDWNRNRDQETRSESSTSRTRTMTSPPKTELDRGVTWRTWDVLRPGCSFPLVNSFVPIIFSDLWVPPQHKSWRNFFRVYKEKSWFKIKLKHAAWDMNAKEKHMLNSWSIRIAGLLLIHSTITYWAPPIWLSAGHASVRPTGRSPVFSELTA